MFAVLIVFHHGKRGVVSSPAASCLVQLAARHVSRPAGDGGGHRSGPGGRDRGAEGHPQGPQEPVGGGWPGVGLGCPLRLRTLPPGLVPVYRSCGAFLPTGPFPGLAAEADLTGPPLPLRPGGRASVWEVCC
jgi:hypothetical protein